MQSWPLASAAQTEAFGAAIARAFADRGGFVIHLEGPLGSGKTTLVRGLLREFGVSGTIRSPTYTLLEPYAVAARSLVHLDLYRLEQPRDAQGLGLADYPPDRTWWLVEWPRKGQGLPAADLLLTLAHRGGARDVAVSGQAADMPALGKIASAFSARLKAIAEVVS